MSATFSSAADDFETPYGPEMTELAGGSNFILGMQDGPDYRRMKSVVLGAFPPGEVEALVRPIAARHSRDDHGHAPHPASTPWRTS